MDVRWSSSNAMQKDSFGRLAALCEQLMYDLLNCGNENWRIVFRVPVEMQEDLVVNV